MDLKDIYTKRDLWTHKGKNGYVLIVAGSKRYSGSPVFNAISCLRAGADLAVCVGPKRAMDIAASFLPDMICHPLEGDNLRIKHVHFILRLAKNFDSIVLGCGLGKSLETFKAVYEIIEKIDLPMVLDADGIKAISFKKEIVKGKKIVLTPNSYEFEILTKEKIKPEIEDRKKKVKRWAKKLECVILLKGHIDVISDGRKVDINETGSPFMTKGGFGDSLAGILGAILAKGVDSFKAAKAAAFINGKAGQLAGEKYKEGVLASDIFNFIPLVIEKYSNKL